MNRREFTKTVAGAGLLACSKPLLGQTNKLSFTRTILQVDHVNGNNRLYPRAIIEKAVEEFSKRNVPTLGEFVTLPRQSNLFSNSIRFEDATHRIKRIYLKGDYLKAEIEILKTPNGRILQGFINDNILIAFRPSGIGGNATTTNGVMVIKDSYKLITVDAMPAKDAVVL